jgi:hypothetical protein
MSVGNLKDSGNQGNNFPYQLKSLQGLQCICDALGIDGDLYDQLKEINTTIAPQNRTAKLVRTSTSGTIKAFSFSIANVGNANGTALGATLAPGEVVNFDAGTLNNIFATVSYDATGTTFLITSVE